MNIYLIVIFCVFVIIMVGVIFQFWKIRHQQVNAIASIVTVIGVLGTFAGITYALFQFDTENIEASVPQLLNGLKFAFVTSILGITGSICLKWLALKQKPPDPPIDPTELLQNILAVEREGGQATRKILRSIERSLTGEGNNTVLTQVQELRTTFSDKQDDLIGAFNKFANQMTENNTKALIEALKEVIEDFNAKISEQFGENFKQLNEAVGKINEWQEQYRQQMDKLAAQFRVAATSIEKSRESLEIVADRSNAIVSSAERLNPILEAIQHQINLFEDNLKAFQNLANDARNAFPIIKRGLNELTVEFSSAVKKTIADSDKAIENQRKALVDQSEQLEKTVKASTRLMAQQITVLDTALENELTKALNSLGHQLTSLSRQFVEDYTPLTDQLRRAVEIASSLPPTTQHQ